jgi:hypothetical protein
MLLTTVVSASLATNSGIKFDNGVSGLGTNGTSGLALQSNIAGTGLTFTTGTLSVDAIDLDSSSGGGVTGILPIANGGTNASTEAQARTKYCSLRLLLVQTPARQFSAACC